MLEMLEMLERLGQAFGARSKFRATGTVQSMCTVLNPCMVQGTSVPSEPEAVDEQEALACSVVP